MKNKGWAWWCHHNRLLEYCTDYLDRIQIIKTDKPLSEVPARLQAFQFTKVKVPAKLLKAWAACEKAQTALNKAETAYKKGWRTAYDEVMQARNKAFRAYLEAHEAYEKIYIGCFPKLANLFRKEHPDVVWDEDKKRLIF